MNAQRRKELSAIITDLNAVNRAEATALEDKLSQLQERIENVMWDEEEAYDNLPDGLKNSAKGEAMAEAISSMQHAVSSIYSVIEEIGSCRAAGSLEEVIGDAA